MSSKKSKNHTKQGSTQSFVNKKAAEKKKRNIITAIIAAVLVIAIVIAIVVVAKKNSTPATTRITTYNIDEITYGNVSTTISGSGSLTPMTKATLTLVDCIEDDGVSTAAEGETPPLEATPTVMGTVSDIAVSVGDTVDEGDVIAVITSTDGTETSIVAPYDAVLLEFYLHDGDEVTVMSEVAMFMGTDGYSMTISVDETNISLIELDQEVDITIDAVSTDDELVGYVTDISYNGSTSGSVTAYGIEVTFDYVEGTYPGMSVSAEIVIEDSGDGLLVPVDAVYTSGDTDYVYLAPSNAALGDEYDEGDVDTSKLTKVTVETGMSDGTYIIIESDELSEGDLIVITTVSSTLTGSESEGSGSGGMGGFGGGGMGSFPGGGDFDFGSFDPGQFGGSFPFGG